MTDETKTEQLWWIECTTCGYDSEEAGFLDKAKGNCICPICAADCGHDKPLVYTKATPEQKLKVYGKPVQ